MRLTPVLHDRVFTRMLKLHWFNQGRLKLRPTTAVDVLKSHGHEVVDVNEVLFPPKEKEKLNYIGVYDPEPKLDENHPDYHKEPCYIYKDDNVLLEGLDQAKVLTNTVEISNVFPEIVTEEEKKLQLPEEIHSDLKKRIMTSCVFEATQKKLPKRKDPLRPAWGFPRDYGIIDSRKNELLCKNLLTVCERVGKNIRNKSVVLDAFFSAPFEAHNKKLQFEVTSELTVTSEKKINALAKPSETHSFNLPDIFPVDCTVSLPSYNFFDMQNIYPFNVKSKWPYVQMALLHHNKTQVKNIFEEEVTETQIIARCLLKGFSIAAAKARALFGENVKELPEPVVVPVVQTDGNVFNFTLFQLNTLEVDRKSEVKNIFWNSPPMSLYEACEYKTGKPVLENYNPDVIRNLVAFYNIE